MKKLLTLFFLLLAAPAFALFSTDVLTKIKAFQLGRNGTILTDFKVVRVIYPAATGISGTVPVLGVEATDIVFPSLFNATDSNTSTSCAIKGVKPSTNAVTFYWTAAPNATNNIAVDLAIWKKKI